MLTRRIIPCLDVDRGRVVKGVKFFDHVTHRRTARRSNAIRAFPGAYYQAVAERLLDSLARVLKRYHASRWPGEQGQG